MRGDRVFDDGVWLESIWDGAKRGDDSDLFNPPDQPVSFPEIPRRISRQEACGELLACLGSVSLWRTDRLREETGLTAMEFEAALNRLRRQGVIVSVSRGVVRLATQARAA